MHYFSVKKIVLSPFFILFLFELLLFVTNYVPGTYFLGWDNLLPEMNLFENIRRSFFSVWQEYRGLGLLDGMSFASNIVHNFFILFLSLFFPANLIRYIFIFVMHFVGGVGVYLLTAKLFKSKTVAFISSLFYLFNFATIQTFFAPYELFLVHFAFLPWLIHFCLKYFKSGTRKDLLFFALLSFLSWPQAHVPTIFIVYFGALLTVLLFSFGVEFKKKAVIFLITLAVNAPWLLPYTYSAFTNASTITNSKINIASSDSIYLKNKVFGNFVDTALMKGFELDTIEVQKDGSGYMMPAWRQHTNSVLFKVIGLCFFAVALLGAVLSIVGKQKSIYPFVAMFFISFVMLGQDIPVLNLLPQFLNGYILFFKQAFRFTFTKFSLLFAFAFSVLVGNGFRWFFEKRASVIKIILIVVFSGGILFLSFPVWRGNFLYDNLRLKIPEEYFETINFFKNSDKNTRVATLPQPSFWGWTYTDWGFRGSGFVWFGIPQPTLDGAFMPWSRENENYYWEISYALYSKNKTLFENVLEKYQINWVLVDGNTVNPGSAKALFLGELDELISASNKFELVKTFGKIKIYKVNLETPSKDFIYLTEDLPVINGYEWGNYDRGYEELGDYISVELNAKRYTLDAYYPFRSLFTGRKTSELDIEIEDLGDKIVFKKKLPEGLGDYLIQLPKEYDGQELVEIDPVSLDSKYFIPTIDSDGKTISVSFPKIKGLLSFESNQNLPAFYLPNLSHKYSYLISAKAKNIKGKNFLFWLENLTNRKADQEIYLTPARSLLALARRDLAWVIQPPMAQDGLGYTLHFDNISIGREETVNELGKISVNVIPYRFLTEVKLISEEKLSVNSFPTAVSHPNPSLYEIKIDQPVGDNTTLVLSQAFHQGWLAFDLDQKKEIKDHFLINNWANGWSLEEGAKRIVLVFWPQYLQYLGFGLFLIILLFFFLIKPPEKIKEVFSKRNVVQYDTTNI